MEEKEEWKAEARKDREWKKGKRGREGEVGMKRPGILVIWYACECSLRGSMASS